MQSSRPPDDIPIFGICGGYQMLGKHLHDPHHLESPLGSLPGLGLLDFSIEFHPKKTLATRTYTPTAVNPFASAGPITGYEIHSGLLTAGAARPLYTHATGTEGDCHPTLPIFGTFIHDLFRNPALVRGACQLPARPAGAFAAGRPSHRSAGTL